jgi:hypothetical protein
MAIDTRSKRASAVGFLAPWAIPAVEPDGSLDQGDRQHSAWTYSGILAGIPSAYIDPDSLVLTESLEWTCTLTESSWALVLSESSAWVVTLTESGGKNT